MDYLDNKAGSSLPRVSIVTPSFNQARFLEQTIRSVLVQDYPNLEYLIVDGGSTDGSLETIRKYAGYLDWWVSEPDAGQAQAINKGLARARGEIFAWLNSDDLYRPGAIAAAVEVFRSNPRAVLVFGDAVSIDESGRPLNDQVFGYWQLPDLMAFQIICQPAVFMRRSAVEQAGGLDEGYHFLLDHHLWLRLALLGEIAHIPEKLAFARQHSQAKNVAQAARFGDEAYRIVEWLEIQPAFGKILKRNRRRAWAGAHRLNARYLLDGGRPGPALLAYWRSTLSHPPTATREVHRMLFALLSLVGLRGLGEVYYRWRRRQPPQSFRKWNIESVQELFAGRSILKPEAGDGPA
jgi:glycosyltransferase involved in cell wall biosynthesis